MSHQVVLYGGAPYAGEWPQTPAPLQPFKPAADPFIDPRLTKQVDDMMNNARLGAIEHIEWIIKGVDLGKFTPAEAIEEIRKAVGSVK